MRIARHILLASALCAVPCLRSGPKRVAAPPHRRRLGPPPILGHQPPSAVAWQRRGRRHLGGSTIGTACTSTGSGGTSSSLGVRWERGGRQSLVAI